AGRVALVTGGGTGIGQATAVALARAGADVGIHFHSSESGARTARQEVEALRRRALQLQGSLTVDEEANSGGAQLLEDFVTLGIRFNNAGTPVRHAKIEQCPTELWRQVLDVNVSSAFFVTRRAISHLRAGGHGSIINNLSLSLQTGGQGTGPYVAAKGALQGLTRALARELA